MSDANQRSRYTRRDWLKCSLVASASAAVSSARLCAQAPASDSHVTSQSLVPIRAITRGPKFHWFGYYDKLEFDPTNRYVLSAEVSFEHRTPKADDKINVGMVDTENEDRWIELGSSQAWGWQQGCMLQWRPQSKTEVLWNDRQDGRFVCHILDVHSRKRRTLPRAVYAVSPDGRNAVTADFARIQNMRPGYGYKGVDDPYAEQRAPQDSGIWRQDLKTGDAKLIVSLSDIAKIPHDGQKLAQHWNYFNHLLISPDGSRFVFLHRWRESLDTPDVRASRGFVTRMITANMDGSDLYVLDPSGFTSHFIWRDGDHICAWTQPKGSKRGFYLFRDKTHQFEPVGQKEMPLNGHNTYLPIAGNEWILNDTYPDAKRRQTPYLYHVPTRRRIELGHFYVPPEYKGEWRCDLHPRSSNDGRLIALDSPHRGKGRQVYLLDVSEIVSS